MAVQLLPPFVWELSLIHISGCFMRSSSPMSSNASFSRKSALSVREMREKMALAYLRAGTAPNAIFSRISRKRCV